MMKKRHNSKKLSLEKLKIAKLSDQNKIKGGTLTTWASICFSCLTVRPPNKDTTTAGPTQQDR